MTKRTRLFLFLAAGVLVVGLGTGLLASYMGQPLRTLVGANGPEELKYLPVDVRLVAFADVAELMRSEIREKLRALRAPASASAGDLESRTGVDVEHDIDRVVAGVLVGEDGGGNQRPLVLARGRFETGRIESVIRGQGGQVEDYKGHRLLAFDDRDQELALAFVEPGLIAVGTIAAVRLAIDTGNGDRNVTDNGEMMAFLHDIDGENAWAIGRIDALAAGGKLPQQLADQLPPINWFAASGSVDSGIHGVLRVEAQDDAAAQNLRDVIVGFITLARLQAGRSAELTAALNSLKLGVQGTTVSLAFSVSPDIVNLLGPPAGGGRPGVGRDPGGDRNLQRPSAPLTKEPSGRTQAQVF